MIFPHLDDVRSPGNRFSYGGKTYIIGDNGPLHVNSAFHLPEVCRLVYTETATLGYPGNTFDFHGLCWSIHEGASWAECLLPAHRDSIRNIRVGVDDFVVQLESKCGPVFTTTFPGLQRLRISGNEINCDVLDWELLEKYSDPLWTWEHWKIWMRGTFNEQKGKHVQLIFES